MVRNLAFLAVLAVLLGGCISVHETQRVVDPPSGTAYTETIEVKEPVQVLRHVVLIQFKEGTATEDIRKVENAFSTMASKVDTIYDYEWGTDVSAENRSKGFTHCFIISFLNETDRDTYLPHPAHKELLDVATPYLGDVLVVDFWAK